MSFAAAFAIAGEPMDAADKLESDTVAARTEAEKTSELAVAKDREFKPPAGFREKKRGALTVYCRKERETGSRFATEKCLDEAQMRDYLLVLKEQQNDIDRIRATCGGGSSCGQQ